MNYLISAAAGLIGGFAAVLLLGTGRTRKRRNSKTEQTKKSRRKFEFSKLVLSAVLFTYFAGFGVGVWAVFVDPSQLSVLLTYIAGPTITATGFYAWKAKAENVVKIKQSAPKATEGMPVDLNNIQP
ncbi:hypothetical protein [uncultured Dysosmobacter sp.]|uniref:hypothetical protein n=1 Tax=uncultured Dysosmobacter sp. TaxID=2591384 RepID=UPI00261BCA48|nr:hypothetical protein [uncultured Dysosmobacter sp.]